MLTWFVLFLVPVKKSVAPGHEIVEMGLVKLYRVTGKKEYLSTAKFFIEARGHYTGYDPKNKDPWKNGAYWQDNIPVIKQDEAEGHAVRAGYLYSAVADVAALTGDDSLLHAIDKIWNNMVKRKCMCREVLGRSAVANVMEIIMNCRMQQPITKPAQLSPMFTGITACSYCMAIQNTLMYWKKHCTTV
jgi:hypothetical protein